MLYTNRLPKVDAIDARITGSGGIKDHVEYLYENAGPAILAWMIEGARRVIDMGPVLPCPRWQEAATAKYREENDWLAHFLTDTFEIGAGFTARSGRMFQAYRSYRADTSDFARNMPESYADLDLAGSKRKHTKAGTIVSA